MGYLPTNKDFSFAISEATTTITAVIKIFKM